MSKIEWCDVTWNVTAGCEKVSQGCKNCWAIRTVPRLAGNGVKGYEGIVKNGNWTGKIELLQGQLQKPFKFGKKGKRVFVNSMSDLFHEAIPESYIMAVFAVIESLPQHTFMILTKRPEKALKIITETNYAGKQRKFGFDVLGNKYTPRNPGFPMPNLWLGVSVEDQPTADERIPVLLQIPAAKHFISLEPQLGSVDLENIRIENSLNDVVFLQSLLGAVSINRFVKRKPLHFEYNAGFSKLDWAIVGGESGPGARPMHPEWVRQSQRQCSEAGVPFFFKQWGVWGIAAEREKLTDKEEEVYSRNQKKYRRLNINGGEGFHGEKLVYMEKVGKKKAGHLLDGKEYFQIPINK